MNLKFPFFSDTAVCYEILQEWDFGFVHQVLTFTRRHNETQTATLARRLDIVNHLILLKEYGRLYLDQSEYERCFQIRLQSYYSYLGNKLSKTWDKTFWNYHRATFERIGCRLDWTEVFKAALQEKLEIILFPAKKMLKRSLPDKERLKDQGASRQCQVNRKRSVKREVIGVIPAGGQGIRISPLPCSKEIYPIGFDESQEMRPKVACHYLLEKMRASKYQEGLHRSSRRQMGYPGLFARW